MAVFNKNSLTQVSGFDNPIISGELVYQQKTYWNLTMAMDDGTPIDLTGATISAQVIRRELSNVQDTRYGLTFDIAPYTVTTPSVITMTITNRDDTNGQFTLVIDDNSWIGLSTDDQMAINSASGAGFSGRIKIGFPALGATPAEDSIIFLLFIVRSDGIVKETA